jgi:energy-coupling factor transport system ATP-binding protein
MIAAKNLTHIYNRGTPWEVTALDRISFQLERGECLGVVGESGSGKSTLAYHLAGILSPTLGSVLINGSDIFATQRGREMGKEIGLIFQSPGDQLFEESVFKEISFGLRQREHLDPREIEERVRAACRELCPPLEDLMDRSPFSVLISNPEVLIFDEPCAGLDPENRGKVLDQIQTLHRNKKTLIIFSNQCEGLTHLFDRIMFMHRGRIMCQGRLQDLLISGDIDRRVENLLPPLIRMLIHLREAGIQVNPSLDTPSSISLEIHHLLEKKRDNQ